MDDLILERMLELKLDLANCREKVAANEVLSLQHQHSAWAATALLRKAREYAMRAHYHLSNDEPTKAKEQMGNLLELLKVEDHYPGAPTHKE